MAKIVYFYEEKSLVGLTPGEVKNPEKKKILAEHISKMSPDKEHFVKFTNNMQNFKLHLYAN
jgi:hypothetical protein